MNKKILGILSVISTSVLALTMVFAAKPKLDTFALMNRNQVGTNTEYSVTLPMYADYENNTISFGYNASGKVANDSNSVTEYTLSWVNGNSQQFSIYNGEKFLGTGTGNTFIESDTPVYWGHSEKGIGRTLNGTTRYIYYNNGSPRFAPYTDKVKQDGTLTAGYAPVYFYSSEQLNSWKGRCSGDFAEACLTTLISGNFIPSEGETPIEPEEGITIKPNNGTAVENSDYTIVKDGVTVAVTASTLTADQIRVFKGKTITISATGITKIEFTCTANGTAKYGPGCFAALDGYTYEASGKKGTWTGSANNITFTASTNQVRITQIVVELE